MTANDQKKCRTGIIKLLRQKGIYDKETDDFLVDNLVFNLKLIADSKRDILTRGTIVDIGKSDSYFQINFSIGVFHNAVKSINTILKQLGLQKIQVESEIEKFDVNSFLNEDE